MSQVDLVQLLESNRETLHVAQVSVERVDHLRKVLGVQWNCELVNLRELSVELRQLAGCNPVRFVVLHALATLILTLNLSKNSFTFPSSLALIVWSKWVLVSWNSSSITSSSVFLWAVSIIL